jgi:acetyl-CoA C-acetyltransferase
MGKSNQGRPVYIVDGSRSPCLKAQGVPGSFTTSELAVQSARPLLARQTFEPTDLDELILGCIMPSPDEANIARVVALRLGCGNHVPAWTVQRNCGSGMQAIDCGAHAVTSGNAELILCGGTEAMSYAPLLFSNQMATWFGQFMASRTPATKIKTVLKFRPALLKPVIALLRGLTDPVVNLSMGQTAEIIAHRFGITREAMDAYAVRSHQRLAAAYTDNRMSEVEILYDIKGNYYDQDDGVRPDSSIEKLAKLRPVFDKEFGLVTAGNSAQITDGAAWVILASEDAVKKHQLSIMARISDSQWSGLSPETMGLGPIHAMTPILQRQILSIKDIDYWEINEAFAGQVLACLSAWQDEDYCSNELNLEHVMGEIDQEKLNIDGGGISLGHPVGMSGARIVLHLCQVLNENKANKGLASLCIGGGQGGAMLIERDTA